MNTYAEEEKVTSRPVAKKHVRHDIDRKIWQWSLGKNVSKRDIKEFARKSFEKEGFTHFKASDGWYRRWFCRWRKQKTSLNSAKCDNNIERLNTKQQHLNEESTNTAQSTSIETINTPFKCDINKINNELISTDLQLDKKTINALSSNFLQKSRIINKMNDSNLKDSNETVGLIKVNNFTNNLTTNRRKGERYLPHFKNEVVSYALNISIKEAASCYKVDKGTISDWIRENSNSVPQQVTPSIKTAFKPDLEFIKWLRYERQKEQDLNGDILKKKIEELNITNDVDDVDKHSQWFVTYCKRFENNSHQQISHIMYPVPFKYELVQLCKKFPKKTISQMFNVDRKRIRDWCNLYNKGKLKEVKRKVDNYLTDDKVDQAIWDWYQLQSIKPTSKQVRDKACEMYCAAGFTGVRCSPGWYYRWTKRYSLPAASQSRTDKDIQLLEWLLSQLDSNNNVSYAVIKTKASSLWGPDLKPSTSWVIRFCKRYSPMLQNVPNFNTKLPLIFENKIDKFKKDFTTFVNGKHLQPYNIVAFDEVPLTFTSTVGSTSTKSLIRKSGFENCRASIIISCLSDGTLLPTALILKTELENISTEDRKSVTLFVQTNAVNDETTISAWFREMLLNIQFPSVLICDEYMPHIYLNEIYKNEIEKGELKMLTIPGGCNSKLQPILFSLAEQFKTEINNQWSQWDHENSWTSVNRCGRLPSDLDIYNWVMNAHCTILRTSQAQIEESFIRAGYVVSSDRTY